MNPHLSLLLPLLLPACRQKGTPILSEPSGARPGPSRVSAPLPGTPPRFSDVLGIWEKRFAKPSKGASDAPIPSLPTKTLNTFKDLFQTATSKGRTLARFRKRAQSQLQAHPNEALTALHNLLQTPKNSASSLSDEQSMGVLLRINPAKNALGTFCLRHLEDPGRPLLRQTCASRLGDLGFPHATPKLLRRLKYETNPEVLIAVFLALGKLGNPSGLANLLAWLQDPKWAARAGKPLVTLIQILGQTYDPKTDGWAGLTRKAKQLLQTFKEQGSFQSKTTSPNERTLREYWLFLRHLNGTKLRPIDDARFICKRAGLQPVPLLGEACLDKHPGVRVRILQILIDLGHPSQTTLDRVRPLLADPLCAPYAIEAIGALGGEKAWETLRGLIQGKPPAQSPREREFRIATLKALMHLEEKASIPLLQGIFAKSSGDLEIQVYAAAALRTAARAQKKSAEEFLRKMLKAKAFHPPTLRELLDQ